MLSRIAGSTAAFGMNWPLLLANGFGPDQVRQIMHVRRRSFLPLDDIVGSLHSAEWELQTKNFPSTRKGVASYLFVTLRNKGTYRRLGEYVSPERKAEEQSFRNAKVARDVCEEAKRDQEQIRREEKDQAFAAWLESLSAKELSTIDAGNRLLRQSAEATRRYRRYFWEKHVLKSLPEVNAPLAVNA